MVGMQEDADFDELIARLKKLTELREEGTLTESEYVRLKTRILDKLNLLQ